MSKVAARNAKVFIGGRDVTTRSNNVTLTFSSEAPEVTSFGATVRERMQDGIRDAEMTVDGFFDSAASQVDLLYYNSIAASAMMGFYPCGATASQFGREFPGIITNYESTAATEDATVANITIAASPPFLFTTMLFNGTLGPAAGASPQSSVDFGNGDTGWQYAVVRLLTLTGTTPSFSASVQESANDAAWTTIFAVTAASFDSAGSPTGASLSALISSASRYRRVSACLAGTSPCATFMVATGSFVQN